MYMRGVFLIPFYLLICAVAGASWSGELVGSAGPEGGQWSFYLAWERQDGPVQLSLGAQVEAGEKVMRLSPRWQLGAVLGPFALRAGQNVDHLTTGDLFRLVNKEQHGPETSFVLLEGEQLKLGLLRRIPLRGGDLGQLAFAESKVEAGPFSFSGLRLHFVEAQGPGWAAVFQAGAVKGNLQAVAASGVLNRHGSVQRGRVVELEKTGDGARGRLRWQWIEPGFVSLAAKSNRYTPNRTGWQLELALPVGPWEAGLELRKHTDLGGTRQYNRLAFTLQAGETWTWEWRLAPTRAFLVRREEEAGFWQVDLINGVLRRDWERGRERWSLRADIPRRIGRLEVQLNKEQHWRVVFKYDFLRHLAHCYLRIRWGKANGHVQLEVGRYDGGNLTAAFGQPLSLRLSWTWEF